MHTFEIDMFSTFVIVFLGCLPDDSRVSGKLDKDGFPPIGSKLEHGDPCYR
jgi:DNA-directed RNA polymerase I subunit RPA2